jgi:hypothetical protein
MLASPPLSLHHSYMNKIFLSVAVLLVAATAQAQTQKGNQLLGGLLNLTIGKGTTTEYDGITGSTPTTSNNKLNTFGIGPSYSYFIADNLDLGANAGYSSQKQSSNYVGVGTDAEKQKGYNYSVYLRRYFLFENKVGFRIGPYANYQYLKSSAGNAASVTGLEKTTNKDFGAGIGFDFVYFASHHLGLAATLGTLSYSHVLYSQFQDDHLIVEDKDHSFGLNLANSNLALSVFYSFGK